MDYEKLHKDTIGKLQEMVNSGKITVKIARGICADFIPDSEDEKIRKDIITYLTQSANSATLKVNAQKFNKWIAWLKKQKEQELNDDEYILQRFSFYTYKDEPNILYLSGLYINSEYRGEGIGTKILATADKVAESIGCNSIRLKTEISSNAERLYRRNGYNTLKKEDNQVWLEKKIEQKSDNKVELNFKVGNWYQCTKDFFGKGITFDKNTAYYCAKEGCLQDEYGCHIAIIKDLYDNFKLWTIQDAKDGDVLCVKYGNDEMPFIFTGKQDDIAYCALNSFGQFVLSMAKWLLNASVLPATKEQRDLLFAKMKKAGYEWDAKKKELKKIGQKPTWGEEDEKKINYLIALLQNSTMHNSVLRMANEGIENWLKSIKDRVQSQPKQEWKQENTGDLTDFENMMMHIGGSFFGDNAGLDPNDTNAIKEQANLLLKLVPSKIWKL